MPQPAEHRSILLVDDNPDDRARVHRMLRGQSRRYEIVDCESGAEALTLLRRGDVRFDCVVLDQYLSDMEGVAVLEALRGANGSVPVAVTLLTGHENDAAAAYALELGAEDYLLKDEVTPHALVRSIENVIEKFEIRRELEEQRAAIEMRNDRLEAMRDEAESRLSELAAATQARDRFIAMMSHEMRTPLNAILGYAELLELEIEGQINDGQRRNLDRIRAGSRHLLDLINDVLDLARADARKLELDLRAVDVNAAIEEVAALLENQATQKGLVIRHRVDTTIPLAAADLQRMRQILTNLVGNAIKFTERGEIAMSAHAVDGGRAVAIEVSDTGIGIEPEALGAVFNEFYQANSAFTRIHGGSGLGLAISQRLADAMNGSIGVESTVGRGSTFTLTLPAAAEGSAVRAHDLAQHDARMAHHETRDLPGARREPVSVVAFGRDGDALASLARQVRPAVRLAWTTSAADVADTAARERASLVILEIDGHEGAALRIAHALSEMHVEVPPAILLLPEMITRADAPAGGAAGLDLGWVALVPKPFTADQLARAVSTAAGQREAVSTGTDATTVDVLVIDDDEDSRRVASRVLREKGIGVRESIDGEHGLVEMRVRPPDVVVLDLMMPVLDGFGVLATMRADPLLASIPVVVLTAKTLTDAERQFLTRSAVRVLQKGEHRLADIAALVLRAAISAKGDSTLATPERS